MPTTTPKVLALAGALREGSFNKKLAAAAAQHAKAAGADVTFIDLRDYPLPIYDEDLEKSQGLPPNARKLKDLFLAHQGFIISTPEYNSSYSGAFKNAIDWISRPATNPDGSPEKPLECFDGKIVALYAASPGERGGLRVLPELRRLLANINCIVLPHQMGLPKSHEAFDDSGKLKDPKADTMCKDVATRLVNVCKKMMA